MGSPPLATQSNDGLLSASDKRVIDGLNPNIVTTLSNLNTDQLQIINAKEENAVDMTIVVEPTIAAQVRTDNLLDVHGETTPGFYISGTGSLSNNANDIVSDFIPVSPGDDIYYTGIIGPTTSASINRRLHVYKSDKTWIKQLNFAGSLHEGDHWSTHGVVPNNGAYVRVSWGVNDTHVMISVGAPQNYEPYYVTPFTASGPASFKVGATSDPEEATTYTYTIPTAAGNQYGFLYNPITGKLTQITQRIASYNGETLPDHWISDRDDPAEDETPSTGAEVIYWLDEEDYVEYDGTPITVPLNYHINFFFIDGGKLQELKYYAETLAVDHLTVYNGMTFNGINVLGEDFQNLKDINSLLDTKADIDSPAFTGSPISTAPSRTDMSRRIATAGFTQNLWNNVAPVETTYKASRNYAVGDYVYILGTLYKVTVAVPQNGTLAVGTNIVATTVMDEMESRSDAFIIHTETTTAGQYYNQWTGSTDKTFNEIMTAYNANKILILIDDDKIYSLKQISSNLISFEAVPNIQQTDSYYKSYAELYKDVSITYSTIRIDNSNVATRIKTPTTIVNHHPIIIEILDADGNTFKNGNDLTTLNANSITVGMDLGSWGYGSISSGIFNPLTQVVVGDQTNFWNDDYATSSSEWYNLVKYTVEYEELPDSHYVFNKHIGTFKTLSERNGIPVIKTITIIYREDLGYYPFDEGDNLSQITATYSEVALSSQ